MSNGNQQIIQPAKTGVVASALALFQGRPGADDPGRDPLSGLSLSDLSGAEQSALVEAKKRKNASGGSAGSAGSGSGQLDGAVVVNKLDLMSLLKEQQDSSTNATKLLLSQHTDQTIAQNTKLLATFGEGVQQQLGQFNCRVENVEHDTSELKTDVKKMQALLAEVQDEQKRQAEVLLLANRQGGISQTDLDADNFSRPPNLEIVQISSPKFVSLASVENALKPYMETQQISADIWNLKGNTQGKRFSMQFAQNSFTSAKLAQQVVKGLHSSEGWKELFADTAKPNKDGTFEKVKLFIGPDQTHEQRSTLFMRKKLVEACEKVHPDFDFSFWKQKGVVQVVLDGKKVSFAKMCPTSPNVDETMVRWELATVCKFDKAKILSTFRILVIDPIDATEWCL